MYPNTFKLIFFNVFVFAVLIVAYFYGFLASFYSNDASHLTYIITVLMMINTSLAIYDSYIDEKNEKKLASPIKRWFDHITGLIPYFGLAGTVYGFILVLLALNVNGDIMGMLVQMKTGCLTLANATLFGVVAYMWQRNNEYLSGDF